MPNVWSSLRIVVVKPSSAPTTVLSRPWKAGLNEPTTLGVRITSRALNSHIDGRKACAIATVATTLVLSVSDHSSGATVSIGPDWYARSGAITRPAKVRLCGTAPANA